MFLGGVRAPLTFGYEGTSHDEFERMIAPALPVCCNADVQAILTRSTVILRTPAFIYARPWGVRADVTIERHISRGSYITADAKKALEAFTEHRQKRDDSIYSAGVVVEQKLFNQLLVGGGDARAFIKKEEEEDFHERVIALSVSLRGHVVDCDEDHVAQQPTSPSSSLTWKDDLLATRAAKLAYDLADAAIQLDD